MSVPDSEELRARIGSRLEGVMEQLLDWSISERRLLDRLHDDGEVDAEALDVGTAMQDRIRTQPMLLWKAQNVRNFRQGDT